MASPDDNSSGAESAASSGWSIRTCLGYRTKFHPGLGPTHLVPIFLGGRISRKMVSMCYLLMCESLKGARIRRVGPPRGAGLWETCVQNLVVNPRVEPGFSLHHSRSLALQPFLSKTGETLTFFLTQLSSCVMALGVLISNCVL